jgi:hypothetical protein
MRYLCCLLVIATVLAGCDRGPAPPKRGKLEGNVTLSGKPVPEGKIWFFALEPDGVNVLAEIKDGKYSVPEDEGPTKGKYRIQFSVPSGKISRTPNPDIPGEWLEEPIELLPPKYHRDSQIVQDYDPDAPKAYDFSLTVP